MSSKDYRELQLSSSQLVIIFLSIIILGVIIFLLGISVGKKKTEIVLASQSGTEQVLENIPGEKPVPIEDPKTNPAEKTTVQQKTEPQQEKAISSDQPQNLDWFIQVGAFNNRAGAQAIADKLKERGLNVIVLDPYASNQQTFFRVRIGGYATKDLAEKARVELVRTDPKAKDYFVIRQR
ncbi:MAG: SPOR domain-containing protein [Candidatus Aminicenantes bacterium]|nr:SPOR domain-containing protein [Candidatus Aminicenantes bacterium]